MFRGRLHSSIVAGVEKILPLRASAPTLFPPTAEKESYEKNTSILITLFGFIVF